MLRTSGGAGGRVPRRMSVSTPATCRTTTRTARPRRSLRVTRAGSTVCRAVCLRAAGDVPGGGLSICRVGEGGSAMDAAVIIRRGAKSCRCRRKRSAPQGNGVESGHSRADHEVHQRCGDHQVKREATRGKRGQRGVLACVCGNVRGRSELHGLDSSIGVPGRFPIHSG